MTSNVNDKTNTKIVLKAPQDPRRVTLLCERLKMYFPFYKVSCEGTVGEGTKVTVEVSNRADKSTIFPMYIEAE